MTSARKMMSPSNIRKSSPRSRTISKPPAQKTQIGPSKPRQKVPGRNTVNKRVSTQVLLVECDDRRGLVHAITGVLLKHGVNVVGNHEFVDRASSRFFMRTEFDGAVTSDLLEAEVRSALPAGANVRFSNLLPKRIVVLVSKEHHCLGDILIRHAFGELNAKVLAVVS